MGVLESRLVSLNNEYSSLAALVCYANARLIGPWNHDWLPPYQLASQMPNIVVPLLSLLTFFTHKHFWILAQSMESWWTVLTLYIKCLLLTNTWRPTTPFHQHVFLKIMGRASSCDIASTRCWLLG